MRHFPFGELQNSLAVVAAEPVGNGGHVGFDTHISSSSPYCVSGRALASLQACNLRGAFEAQIAHA